MLYPLSKTSGSLCVWRVTREQGHTPQGNSLWIQGLTDLMNLFNQFHYFIYLGGNAGIAAAYAAKQLGIPATIVIPGSTPEFVADNLKDINANVIRHGQVRSEVNQFCAFITLCHFIII